MQPGLAVVVLGATTFAGPAQAETAGFPDARGDLAHGADIHRVRVVNDARVTVRVLHRNLVREPSGGSSLSVFFDTDRTRSGPEYVLLGGTFEGTDYTFARARGWRPARTATPLRCGYEMLLDYAEEAATVRVDRGCLGSPRAVRVEVRTGGHLASGETAVDWLGEARRFTPWVRRG